MSITAPRGQARSVPTEQIAQLLERYLFLNPEQTAADLEIVTGVAARQLRKVLARQYRSTDLFVADRICTAMGTHLEMLDAPTRGRGR